MTRVFFVMGALFGGLGVALGAFGAHVLRQRISAQMLSVYETGVHYQLVHAVALLVIAWASAHWTSTAVKAAGWCFAGGILVFSGSLYVLAVTGVRWLGAVTPLGGLAFLAGWALLAWAGWKAG